MITLIMSFALLGMIGIQKLDFEVNSIETPTRVLSSISKNEVIDRLNLEIEVNNDGYHFVDYINPMTKLTYQTEYYEIEIDYILFQINELAQLGNQEFENLIVDLTYSEKTIINQLVEDTRNTLFYTSMFSNANEVEILRNEMNILDLLAKVEQRSLYHEEAVDINHYYPVYYGVLEYFSEYETSIVYYVRYQHLEDESYMNAIYGEIYSYPHLKSVEFEYQSYDFNIFVVRILAPRAKIIVYLDFFSKEKMLIISDNTKIERFFITQSFHWNRNSYNIKSLHGIPIEELYLGDFNTRSAWSQLSATSSYFHKLGLGNENNSKMVNNIKYYDFITGQLELGSNELIFDGDSNLSSLDNESLITHSFNFASSTVDDEVNGLSIKINVALDHYIKDVYPYLIWGNDYTDFITVSPFERFIWDKDSSNMNILAKTNAQILIGDELKQLYLTGEISDGGGLVIPEIFYLINRSLFEGEDEK